ncbi:MAG: hypothetical protein M1835_004339 [Candelina submexicana]|nr:MAG: hypothetical protein M1835_004339 [Candelina submexicana]
MRQLPIHLRLQSIRTRCSIPRRLSTTPYDLASLQPKPRTSPQSSNKRTASTQYVDTAGHGAAGATNPHRSTTSVRLKGVNKTKGQLTIVVDGRLTRFDYKFLRDACSCPRCVDPSTKQKQFQTADIPELITPKTTHRSPAGVVTIDWRNDVHGYGKNHISEYTPKFFDDYVSRESRIRARHNMRPQPLWDRQVMEKKIKWVNYKAYMGRDSDFLEALEHLSAYGLVFLEGVPDSEQSVEKIGTRIGCLRDTFYGRTWDVKSVPNAKNVAYTHQYLGLHMDLLYMAQPPGLQLLHCLRSSCTGGNSIFSDSFHAARLLDWQKQHALENFPVTYHYHNDGEHYYFTHKTLEFQGDSALLENVNWSPPFQAPFDMGWDGSRDESDAFSGYLKAAKAFSTAVEDPESIFELRLEPGQCVVFNNRRVLHARRKFDVKSGERWLKGAYVDSDAFLSKLRSLREIHGVGPLSEDYTEEQETIS